MISRPCSSGANWGAPLAALPFPASLAGCSAPAPESSRAPAGPAVAPAAAGNPAGAAAIPQATHTTVTKKIATTSGPRPIDRRRVDSMALLLS